MYVRSCVVCCACVCFCVCVCVCRDNLPQFSKQNALLSLCSNRSVDPWLFSLFFTHTADIQNLQAVATVTCYVLHWDTTLTFTFTVIPAVAMLFIGWRCSWSYGNIDAQYGRWASFLLSIAVSQLANVASNVSRWYSVPRGLFPSWCCSALYQSPSLHSI